MQPVAEGAGAGMIYGRSARQPKPIRTTWRAHGVVDGTRLFELLHQLSHGGALLAHSHVDAIELLRFVVARSVVVGLLV